MKISRVAAVLTTVALTLSATVACGQGRAPVDPRVKTEITAVDAEIQQAETEDAKYEGGLVKALIQLRIGTLKQTRAMLAQRATAGDLNITIRYTADGKPFTPPEGSSVSAIEAELETMKAKIAAAEAEAARYSGGLVQAMALSSVATLRQSHAMLDQKRLAVKYGLPQFIGFADLNSRAATATVPAGQPAPAAAAKVAPPTTERDWEIVSVDSRVTESNDTWQKYAWKLTIRNKGAVPHAFKGTIEFQDADGFIVDSDDSDTFTVPANSVETATGYALVSMPGATKIARTLAKVAVVR